MRTLDMNKNIENNNMPAPKLRFPGYTGVWEEKALGEVGTFVRGLSYNKGEVTQDSNFTLVLRSNNIVQDAAVDCKNGLQFVTKGPSSEQILRKGDIVICLSNGSSNLVGKSASYEGDYDGVVTVGAFCGIYRSTAPITKYLVQTPAYKKSIDLIKQGGNGALANLYGRDILGLRFYFPSLEEQKRIVECLEAEDLMIAAQEQKVESLKAHKKGLMQQLFPQPGSTTPALRFPGFTGEWEEKKLGECFEIGSGRDYKHLSTGDIPVYGSGGYMCSVNDYLFNGDSACIGRKGTINNPLLLHGKFWTVDTLFYTFNYINTSAYFVYLLFQNIDWMKHNEAGGVPSLSKTIINNISVVLPKPDEQQKIVECISSIDDIIMNESKKVEILKNHKKGLMQQLYPQPVK